MIPLSRNDIATLRGCTPTTVSRANLPHAKDHKENVYDLTNSTVFAWVTEPHVKQRIAELQSIDPEDTENLELLKAIKMQKDIELRDVNIRRGNLQHELQVRHLIDKAQIDYYLGNIGAVIETTFLTLSNRAAKGDAKMKAKLERLIKKDIEKVKKVIADMLRKETELIISEGEDE